MKKINVFQIAGCLLLMLSAAFMLTFFYQRSDGAKQTGQIVQKIEDQIKAKQHNTKQTTDDGAEEAVAAIEVGVLQIAAHTKNRTDTCKGGTSGGEKGINKGTDCCSQRCF